MGSEKRYIYTRTGPGRVWMLLGPTASETGNEA